MGSDLHIATSWPLPPSFGYGVLFWESQEKKGVGIPGKRVWEEAGWDPVEAVDPPPKSVDLLHGTQVLGVKPSWLSGRRAILKV